MPGAPAAWDTLRGVSLAMLIFLGCAGSTSRGTAQSTPGLRGLDFDADLLMAEEPPLLLQATVTIKNHRTTPVTLTFPIVCVGLMRVYENDRSAPVWEQRTEEGCPREPLALELMPEDEREIRIRGTTAGEVLGQDLPTGSYRFTVLLEPDGHVLEIEAGKVELERPRSQGRR